MRRYSKHVYVILLSILILSQFVGYVHGLESVGSWITPPIALLIGLLYAFICGQAYPTHNKKCSKMFLQYSVVGLGFGMNIEASLASSKEGIIFTVLSVSGTIILGWLLGRKLLKLERRTLYLISSGTAICGGSAIAAVGPIINAKGAEMSVALGTIFILNAIALFIFPSIGHALGLDEVQFGTWAAIAIHDTSSVVGAGGAYGDTALEIATTIKLTRALWIIPVALCTAVVFRTQGKKIAIPWFILWFIVAMVVNTYLLDSVPTVGSVVSGIARKCLTVTLFFIGASLSHDVLRQVGLRPLLLGILLWIMVSVISLAYIVFV
ncbi:MAG: putative sulfate exporter family transporter [Bacteroidaceae bacterium]|nr:putative sulfate exporter family transporter [Bacteroidaceae bacterium]